MKVILQLIVSRDGYIAGVGDDISWISEKTREQYTRTIRGMGNCVIGRRAYQRLQNVILNGVKDPGASYNNLDSSATPQNEKSIRFFDACDNPFVVILSKHNYPSQPNRHFTHAKPKNILKLLDEKGRSSTVICGGLETAKLFLDAGVVDMVHLYHEDVDVGEGMLWDENILNAFQLLSYRGYPKNRNILIFCKK